MTLLPNLPVTKISKPVKTFRLMRKETGDLSQFIKSRNELLAIERVEGLIGRADARERLHDILFHISDIISDETVNETFTNSRGDSRFNDDTEEVWYCAFEHTTAVKEKAYHLKRKLEDTNDSEGKVICREVFADFEGNFHDARGEPCGEGILGPDPNAAYKLGQKLAHKLRAKGGRGIIYPSVRDSEKKGICLVAFHRKIVQNVRHGSLWEISCNQGKCKVRKIEEDVPLLNDLRMEGINPP